MEFMVHATTSINLSLLEVGQRLGKLTSYPSLLPDQVNATRNSYDVTIEFMCKLFPSGCLFATLFVVAVNVLLVDLRCIGVTLNN